MYIKFFGETHVGNVRENNEDDFLCNKLNEQEYLFIVADGMGGHNAGEVASKKAVRDFLKIIKTEPLGRNIIKSLEKLVLKINKLIINEGRKSIKRAGMGTTISALYIKKHHGFIVHVGDSRIYRFKNNTLKQITEDHSTVNQLVKDGLITAEQAREHPRRHEIYQSLGVLDYIEVECHGPFRISLKDNFLLCSDGPYDVVDDQEIKKIFKGKQCPQDICSIQKHKARLKGGPDNITVIVVTVDKEPRKGESKTTYRYIYK